MNRGWGTRQRLHYTTRMPRCHFCNREFEKLSEEHIFPAALGGRLVLRNCSCTECNNRFSQFETPLCEELAPIRLLLKIPDRRGNPPQVGATAKTKDKEYEARIKSDGSVQIKPVVTAVPGPNGSREIVFQFATEQQKEKMRRDAQEGKIHLLESEPGEAQEAEAHVSSDLKFIGSEEGLRVAAKIAYMTLARVAGLAFAGGPAFSMLRDYIKNGSANHLLGYLSTKDFWVQLKRDLTNIALLSRAGVTSTVLMRLYDYSVV